MKRVVFKVMAKVGVGAKGRHEEWGLTPEQVALCAEHRDMGPALLLMTVGFDNLAPSYHPK